MIYCYRDDLFHIHLSYLLFTAVCYFVFDVPQHYVIDLTQLNLDSPCRVCPKIRVAGLYSTS